MQIAPEKRLKILCLHGYRQDAELFRSKMGGFRKCVKSMADLYFINAPHVIPDEPCADGIQSEPGSMKKGYSWWFCDDTENFSSKTECKEARGFSQSINVVSDAFKSQGPFDGIVGFSQGAALAALICGLKEQGKFLHTFHFVIIVAGFKSISSDHQYLFDKPIMTHSLHVIGNNDSCIPKDLSEHLMSDFKNAFYVFHEGGHFVPSNVTVKKKYLTFLQHVLYFVIEDEDFE